MRAGFSRQSTVAHERLLRGGDAVSVQSDARFAPLFAADAGAGRGRQGPGDQAVFPGEFFRISPPLRSATPEVDRPGTGQRAGPAEPRPASFGTEACVDTGRF